MTPNGDGGVGLALRGMEKRRGLAEGHQLRRLGRGFAVRLTRCVTGDAASDAPDLVLWQGWLAARLVLRAQRRLNGLWADPAPPHRTCMRQQERVALAFPNRSPGGL